MLTKSHTHSRFDGCIPGGVRVRSTNVGFINFPVRLLCSLRLFFFSRAEFPKVASVFPASTISATLENLSTVAVGKQKRYPLPALAT